MPTGPASAVGNGYSVTVPSVVTRPIVSEVIPAYQRAPSGPTAMPPGPVPGGRATVRCAPSTVIRPIRSSPERVNQSAPSGPVVMINGRPPAGSSGWVRTEPSGSRRAMPPPWTNVSHSAPSGPTVMPYGPASGSTSAISRISTLNWAYVPSLAVD
ncbi:hypothetical protein [Micromonospora sp. NPDC049102]|uniref:hypothetical protein n=1 Tax=Micromonospora sp. NPDC049102 TaxID=3364265 RepID=UPI00371EF066